MFFNERVSAALLMFDDWQSAADCIPYPNWPAHEPRAPEQDAYTVKQVERTAYVSRVMSEAPPPTDADKVQLLAPSKFCSGCVSALGYLAGHLEGKQDDEGKEEPEKQHTNARPAVIHHWNMLSWFVSGAMDRCPLCAITWTRWRSAVEYLMHDKRVDLLRQQLSGRGWENLDEEMVGRVFQRSHGLELAKAYDRFRVETILNTTEEKFWNEEEAGEARLVFALSTGKRTGEEGDFKAFLRFQLWPSPAFDRYFTGFQSSAVALEQGTDLDDQNHDDKHNTRACRPLAVRWLARCRENADGKHDACNAVVSSSPPTRLLDVASVRESGKLYVVSSMSEDGECIKADYIALSHCWGYWGALKLPRLNSSNLESYTNDGIALDCLPATFKDLIEIAGWLGVKYLWIDSLCIIQDSDVDWRHEAARMCDVYANAFLTVSAAGAIDAQKGCFSSRDPLSIASFQLNLPRLNRTWWATVDERDLFDWVEHAPLSKRAWAYQERRLSRRNLHFTDIEVFWECRASSAPSFACESYPDGLPLRRDFLGKAGVLPRDTIEGSINDSKSLREAWDGICQDFSERYITKQTDKLPAISGLAKYFSDLCSNRDRYIAGIWRSSMPHALLWTTRPNVKGGALGPTGPYVAPSWSWLSTDQAIRMPDKETRYHSVVNILEVRYETIDANPFNRIRHASLKIEGFLRRVTKVSKSSDEQGGESKVLQRMIGLDKSQHLYVDDDLEESIGIQAGQFSEFSISDDHPDRGESQQSQYHCLLLAVATGSAKRGLVGLLLEPTDEQDTYRRAGVIHLENSPALRMRYKVKAGAANENHGPLQRERLMGQVKAAWGKQGSQESDKASFTGTGPQSLYELDGGAVVHEEDIFEQLQPQTITLI